MPVFILNFYECSFILGALCVLCVLFVKRVYKLHKNDF